MTKFIEISGKTEEEAIRDALEQLGKEREEVSVEVVERAKSGFLGIGGTPAVVRVSYEYTETKAERVKAFLEGLFEQMGTEADMDITEADGTINMWLVILFATIGADCGATINYIAGYFLGRPIIYSFANSKWGKMCLLNQNKVEKAEKYFDDHGAIATVTGRLIPGIRHLISIPAGLAKMNFWKFLLYTTIGAGVWNCILAALGWYLHTFVNREELATYIELYSEYIKFGILILVLLVIAYFCVKSFRKRHKSTK